MQAVQEEKGSSQIGDADPKLGRTVSTAVASVLLGVDGFHASGPGATRAAGGMSAGLKHRQHAIGDGIAAGGIAGAEQHGDEIR